MQPMKELAGLFEQLDSAEQYLFSLDDLRGAMPGTSPGAFKVLLSRAEKGGLLKRVCKGIYIYHGLPIRRGWSCSILRQSCGRMPSII